ncbi:MAG: hypothetical protein PHV37_08940 [Candidatus Gastranaerophilales bacterium]|nr:hypothetical protein [Candidatus Gastranaerophilales bacterium]
MRLKSLTGLLLVATMISTATMSYAEESSSSSGCSKSADCTVQAVMPSCICITATAPLVSGNLDCQTGKFSSAAPIASYSVKTNDKTVKLYLSAKNICSNGSANSFFQDGASNNYIVLTNTGTNQANTSAVTNCKSITPAPSPGSNPNAIAFGISEFNYNSAVVSPTSFENTKGQYTFAPTIITSSTGIPFTVALATTNRAGTWGYETDLAGNYQSIVTLSSVSL